MKEFQENSPYESGELGERAINFCLLFGEQPAVRNGLQATIRIKQASWTGITRAGRSLWTFEIVSRTVVHQSGVTAPELSDRQQTQRRIKSRLEILPTWICHAGTWVRLPRKQSRPGWKESLTVLEYRIFHKTIKALALSRSMCSAHSPRFAPAV